MTETLFSGGLEQTPTSGLCGIAKVLMYTKFHGEVTEETQAPDYILRTRYFPNYAYRGVYVDLGAGDPRLISNSYHFRMNQWDVFALDASPRMCQQHKKRGYAIVECALGSTPGQTPFISYPNESNERSGGHLPWERAIYGSTPTEIEVTVRTLDDVMHQEFKSIKNKIDILDMDLELSEPDVFQEFTLEKYLPTICLIEDHYPKDSGIQKIMEQHGYHLDLVQQWNHYYVHCSRSSHV